jgi:hypothetical protein
MRMNLQGWSLQKYDHLDEVLDEVQRVEKV